MARVRMVTRTVDITVAEVMQINVSNAEVSIITYELPNTYADNEAIIKYLNKHMENCDIKAVAVQNVEVKEVLYGMPEIDFIQMAQILPPRTQNEE